MRTIKRLFDIVFSVLLIICLSPLFAAVMFLLLVSQGRPVFYVQNRVGKNDGDIKNIEELKCFRIYKFRTFRINSKECASRDADIDEVTAIGRLLRKTSVDELPQLFNILKGDMSFVGPRPLIPAEKHIQQLRLDAGVYSVKPGMTGLAQISGRDDLNDSKKVEKDKEYVENLSIKNDIKILFGTVAAVVTQKGAN